MSRQSKPEKETPFFSGDVRTLERELEITLTSVGVDIGSSTSHLVFSKIVMERRDSVYVVTELEVGEGSLKAHREIEGAEEVIESPLPAVIAAQKGLNEPRYASLKGIMAAKKIKIDSKTVADLGLDEADVFGARATVTAMEMPPEKAPGRKIEDADAATAAAEIVKYMKDEVKAF